MLQQIMQDHLDHAKKPMTPDEIKSAGTGLLRKITEPAWWGLSTQQTPTFQISVPDNIRETMIKEMSVYNNGEPPTESDLQRAYAIKMFNSMQKLKAATK